ncbi:cysteine-rich CWC family protein [uncultured Acetobacteroides sp.]|uniref:cysteine-rich CWC family protein n=1 Tax=uncultured Acetobacteroides sp. TaxID=1760811 RepID=UPI00374894B2
MSTENKQPKQSICPKCGAEFTCSTATGSCWCMELKLSSETHNQLRAMYATCLCPACLAQFAEKDK